MNHLSQKSKGFSLLIFTIVLATAGLLLALTASRTGIQETQNNLRYGLSKTTFAAASGCLEDALLQLNQNHAYTGGSLSLNGVSCTITVSGSGTTRTVDVAAVNGAFTRRLQADANWTASFAVTAWREMNN